MLNKLNDSNWEEVFGRWHKSEKDHGWTQVAQLKGWGNWQEWRGFMADRMNLPARRWEIHEITKPNELIPQFLIGPSKTWNLMLDEAEPTRRDFATLIKKSEQARKNPKVMPIRNQFPEDTQFIGLRKENGEIVLIEGHHRAAAVALANHEESPIVFGANPTIALADWEKSDDELYKEAIRRGSAKKK